MLPGSCLRAARRVSVRLTNLYTPSTLDHRRMGASFFYAGGRILLFALYFPRPFCQVSVRTGCPCFPPYSSFPTLVLLPTILSLSSVVRPRFYDQAIVVSGLHRHATLLQGENSLANVGQSFLTSENITAAPNRDLDAISSANEIADALSRAADVPFDRWCPATR